MRKPALALLPFALLVSGCGASTPNLLVGTWSLTSATCNGTPAPPRAGLTTYEITYGADGLLTVDYAESGCTQKLNGIFKREGLEVIQEYTSMTCAVTCATSGFGSCTAGTTEFTSDGATVSKYRVNASVEGVLELNRHFPQGFCRPGEEPSADVVELAIFTRRS